MKSFLKWSALVLLPVIALLIAGAPAHAFTIDPNHFLIVGATLGASVVTLADWAKRQEPGGGTAKIVELLAQTNAMVDDAHAEMGNLPTGTRATVRTGLPTVTWRLLNSGVPTGKSTTAQVDFQCGTLEARSQVDLDLASLNADVPGFRLSEALPFVEAMSQEFAQTLIYGAASAPEEFVGLAAQYSSLSAANAQNIVVGGGSGSDNMSIWLVGWGPNTAHLVFPKGSKAGIVHEDLGVGDAFDSSNNRFRAYMDRWQWKGGLVVRDWRYVVRIPNIDVSNLIAESSNADLIKLMTKAYHRIPNLGAARFSFYMNRTAIQWLDIQRQLRVKDGGGITFENVDGRLTPTFRGIPIRITDALLETEATVS